jgi:hypothetical protein
MTIRSDLTGDIGFYGDAILCHVCSMQWPVSPEEVEADRLDIVLRSRVHAHWRVEHAKPIRLWATTTTGRAKRAAYRMSVKMGPPR